MISVGVIVPERLGTSLKILKQNAFMSVLSIFFRFYSLFVIR